MLNYLGVFNDYELTFSEHVNHICNHTSRQLNAIRRISDYIKRDCLVKLFHAFVSWNFNYWPSTWHFTSKSKTIKIEIEHKEALRVAYNDYMTSYSGLLDMSNRTPLFLARLKGWDWIPSSCTHYSWTTNATTPAVDQPSASYRKQPISTIFYPPQSWNLANAAKKKKSCFLPHSECFLKIFWNLNENTLSYRLEKWRTGRRMDGWPDRHRVLIELIYAAKITH